MLPQPDIIVDPDPSGLVGTTALLRVEAPSAFEDHVSAGGTRADVKARPSRAECSVGEIALSAAMSQSPRRGQASTPPMPLDLTSFGPLHIVCRLMWDAEWRSSEGESGIIPDRETWNERYYPVGAAVGVLVR